MNFSFTEEQLALEDTVERFAEKELSFEEHQQRIEQGAHFDPDIWAKYAELGLLALPFPEEYDGLGGTALDTFVVMRALAKGLPVEPYVTGVILCGNLLTEFATAEQKQQFIPQVAAGELLLSLAHYEPAGRFQDKYVAAEATEKDGKWVLNGQKSVVSAAESADYLLVSAKVGADQVSLFMVPRDAAGVSIKGYLCHDGSRAADVHFKDVELAADTVIGQSGEALPAILNAIAIANTALMAETSGIVRALKQQTLEYMQTRKQFGVSLSTFQTVQHRLADIAIAAEEVNAMALRAAIEIQGDDLTARLKRASGAKAFINEKARFIGQEAVQLHGGIGVTDELIISHYFKRITLINYMFGDIDFHLQRYSELLEH